MINAHIQPYGTWKSPITSSTIVESAINLGNIVLDNNTLYWNEIRPFEKGRSVVVRLEKNTYMDVNPKPYNVRTRVHEYGGRAFTVHKKTLYFTNYKDQDLYSLSPDGNITKLTTADNKRYAEPVFNQKNQKIYAIEETHHSTGKVLNTLVAIDINGSKKIKTLHTGHDFYSSIAFNPEGTQLAFLTWDHPLMPWDGTELWIGQLLPDGSLIDVKKVAGGHSESIFQPRFAPDGTLFFISDRTGFWNLYKANEKELLPCYLLEAEFGSPQWVFGLSRYDFIPVSNSYNIVCNYTIKGIDHLAVLDLRTSSLKDLPFSFTSYAQIHTAGNHLYFLAASPTEVSTLYSYHLNTEKLTIIRKSKNVKIDLDYLSIPETIEFSTANGKTAFAFYYAPKNRDVIGPKNDKPPLIVKSHGGPSSHVTSILNLEIQFWTSRGFAFLNVNYGGSTGHGREYRERLKGNWGIVDVDDCINGALYLIKSGDVDPDRLAIKGGSAGGYTTLAALTFRNVFKTGTSYFGVSDLIALVNDTHKFESHYLDGLIGDYSQKKERYIQYSPIYHIEDLSSPVLLLQGAKDKVVLPEQSEIIFNALKKKGIPTAYILFKDESHGFRIDKNIKKALDSELFFYSQIFQFTPSDFLEPIPIENWRPSKERS